MFQPLRIAIFGGTFDPVHLGHLEIARKASRALQLDQVIFIPCRRSPHKSEAPGASDEERLEMLRIAIKDIPGFRVDDVELKQPPPSYTWRTVRTLKTRYPEGTRFYLLIGFDQWEALPGWQHPDRIAQDVEFIVVGRKGEPSSRTGCRAHFLKGDHPASASSIRRALGAKIAPRWLDENVASYISKKELYSPTP